MNKKILSMVLALSLTLGSAAALPQGVLTDNTFITASADESYGLFDYYVSKEYGYAMLTGYRGKAENVTIPDKLGGYAVQVIGEKAFYKNENIVTVKIPSTVTTIKYGAFAYCKNLKNLDNLKNCNRLCFIEGSAFYECGNLQMKKSDFPSTLYKIDSFAFYNCQKLEGIDLSDAEIIQGSAFEGCSSLTSIEAPKATDYGASVFKDCENLQNVNLSKDIKTLTNKMFQGCSMLKFSIPNSVTSIGSYCFENCESFSPIVVPARVTYIGDYALGCKYYKTSQTTGYRFTVDAIYCYDINKAVTEEYVKLGGKYQLFPVIVIDCNHTYEDHISKKATCTEKGEVTHTCSQCLDKYTTEIPALGHDWSAWTVVTPATKEKNGTEKRTCNRCGKEETKSVAYAGDEYLLGDVNNDGSIDIKDIIKVAAHVKGKNILNAEETKRADVTGEGKVDIHDLTKIAAHVKGKRLLTAKK